MNCRIYYNLHRRCLSVQTKTEKGWRVTGHTTIAVLKDVAFKVSEAGRQRTIRERRKNVHAMITGKISHDMPQNWNTRVFYNPYKAGHFVDAMGNKVEKADFVLVQGDEKGYSIHI